MYLDLLEGEITQKELEMFNKERKTLCPILNNCLTSKIEMTEIINMVKSLRERFKDACKKYKSLSKIRNWLKNHNLFDGNNNVLDEELLKQNNLKLNILEDAVQNSGINLPKQIQKDIEFFYTQKSILFDEIVKHLIERNGVRKYFNVLIRLNRSKVQKKLKVWLKRPCLF